MATFGARCECGYDLVFYIAAADLQRLAEAPVDLKELPDLEMDAEERKIFDAVITDGKPTETCRQCGAAVADAMPTTPAEWQALIVAG